MIPYIIFTAVILYFAHRNNPKGMLFVLILFAVLRYDTGWDYMMYVRTVQNPSYWINGDHSRFSLLWRELFRFAHFIKCPHIAIVVPNVLTYVFVYQGLKMLNISRQGIVQSLMVYAFWNNFYLDSFSIIRQALSMSIGLIIFAAIQKKQFLYSLILYAIAIHIHTSSIILGFLYPVYLIRSKINFKWITVATVLIIISLFSLGKILLLLAGAGLDKYEIYLNMNDSFGGKITYIYLLFAVYLMFAFRKGKNWNTLCNQCFFLSIVAMFGCVSVYVAGVSSVFTRIFSYYIIFMIPIVYPSLRIFKEYRTLNIYVTIILILYFFSYLIISDGGAKLASSGMLPYKCILFN